MQFRAFIQTFLFFSELFKRFPLFMKMNRIKIIYLTIVIYSETSQQWLFWTNPPRIHSITKHLKYTPQSYWIKRNSGNCIVMCIWMELSCERTGFNSSFTLQANSSSWTCCDGLGCDTLIEGPGDITDGVTKTNLPKMYAELTLNVL